MSAASIKRRLQAFGLAYVRFCEARDRYRQTADAPDATAMAHVSQLGRKVLALAPTSEEIGLATRELDMPPASFAAALDEVEFLVDPRAYLAKHGKYETEVNGKPVTFTGFGDEVLVIGDGDETARAAGPGNFRPVPGGVQ